MERPGIQCELDIAASLDLKRPDHLQGTVAEHVVLLVGQGLGRADDNRVSGMNTDRIDIFHVADRDSGVVAVAHDFILDFLISLNTFLNEYLVNRRQLQGIFQKGKKSFFVLCKTASGASQCKCGAKYERVTDLLCRAKPFLDRMSNF